MGAIEDVGELATMALFKSKSSPYWQIRFEIAGVEVRRSARTRDKRAAEEFEEELRRDLWRQVKLGEQRWTWSDAVERCRLEDAHLKSWERTERSLKILSEYLPKETLLAEIDYSNLLKIHKEIRPKRQRLILREAQRPNF